MIFCLELTFWIPENILADNCRQHSLEDSKLARLSFLRIPIQISSLALVLFSEKNFMMNWMLGLACFDLHVAADFVVV